MMMTTIIVLVRSRADETKHSLLLCYSADGQVEKGRPRQRSLGLSRHARCVNFLHKDVDKALRKKSQLFHPLIGLIRTAEFHDTRRSKYSTCVSDVKGHEKKGENIPFP